MSNIFNVIQVGVVGIRPSLCQLYSDNSLAQVTAAGFLNEVLQNTALNVSPNDFIFVSYASGANAALMVVQITAGQITLSPIAGTAVSDVTGLNLGAGSGVWAQTVGNVLEFKSIVAGANLQVANNSTSVTVSNLNAVRYVDMTAAHTTLASAGKVNLVTAGSGSAIYKVREIMLNSGGTNFSGGGDRDLAITDGTTVYSVIPAATIQALLNARWGVTTDVPFPASAAIDAASAASANIYAQYSGGSADYSAGSLVLTLGFMQLVA